MLKFSSKNLVLATLLVTSSSMLAMGTDVPDVAPAQTDVPATVPLINSSNQAAPSIGNSGWNAKFKGFIPNNRYALAALGVGIVAIAGGLGYFAWQKYNKKQENPQAAN